MTLSVTRWDKCGTHLSSSCIISSYFWMTLAPSAVSKHLQRRWNFTSHAKGRANIFPGSNILKPHFYEASKTAAEWLIHTETTANARPHQLSFFNLLYLRWDSRIGEVSEFEEGGLDALLHLLGPSQPSSYCWHILIHWSWTWGGQTSSHRITQIGGFMQSLSTLRQITYFGHLWRRCSKHTLKWAFWTVN